MSALVLSVVLCANTFFTRQVNLPHSQNSLWAFASGERVTAHQQCGRFGSLLKCPFEEKQSEATEGCVLFQAY